MLSQVAAGLALVRRVLAEKSLPPRFSIHDLYAATHSQSAPAAFKPALAVPLGSLVHPPPNPDHPIRSVKYLKKEIIPHLKGSGELRISSQPRLAPEGTPQSSAARREYLFSVVDPSTIPPKPTPPPPKKQLYTEVGVGADFSHLNKRRQRARVGKISRDVLRMKEFSAKKAA